MRRLPSMNSALLTTRAEGRRPSLYRRTPSAANRFLRFQTSTAAKTTTPPIDTNANMTASCDASPGGERRDLVVESFNACLVSLPDAPFAALVARPKTGLEIGALAGIQIQQRLSGGQRHSLPAMEAPRRHRHFEKEPRAGRRHEDEEHLPETAELGQVQP